MRGKALVAGAFWWFWLLECTRRDPPTPLGSPSVAGPEVLMREGSPSPASGSAAASTLVGTNAADAASRSDGADADPHSDAAGDPQTHDRPHASGAAFDARVAALWAAIIKDEPSLGAAFFFPLYAYERVKAVSDPAADWRHRLFAAYARDIHAVHARLRSPEAAQFAGIEVPEERARWVDPGEEMNRLGYYRVYGSRLRYTDGSTTESLELKSLISWRGEWFVVHLAAIQ